MTTIEEYSPRLRIELPETYRLLMAAKARVHSTVTRIILHGSRGLAGGYRPDSDIDLSLLIDLPIQDQMTPPSLDLLDAISHATLDTWQSQLDVDLAVIFDLRGCGLLCFDTNVWNANTCAEGGVGCFGLYKIQKGFTRLVDGSGIQVKLMYPCLMIWQRIE
jgi:hypothetical protein